MKLKASGSLSHWKIVKLAYSFLTSTYFRVNVESAFSDGYPIVGRVSQGDVLGSFPTPCFYSVTFRIVFTLNIRPLLMM